MTIRYWVRNDVDNMWETDSQELEILRRLVGREGSPVLSEGLMMESFQPPKNWGYGSLSSGRVRVYTDYTGLREPSRDEWGSGWGLSGKLYAVGDVLKVTTLWEDGFNDVTLDEYSQVVLIDPETGNIWDVVNGWETAVNHAQQYIGVTVAGATFGSYYTRTLVSQIVSRERLLAIDCYNLLG